MNDMDLGELAEFGRSWAYAPGVSVEGSAFKSFGYDRSQRCYRIENQQAIPVPLKITLNGSKDSPIHNPAFYIRNWNAEKVRIAIDGKDPEDVRSGIHHTLEGRDLVVFLKLESHSELRITLSPE
jgi:hypothetical protein